MVGCFNAGGASSDSNRAFTGYIEKFNGSTWNIIRDVAQFFSTGQISPASVSWVDAFTASTPAVAQQYRLRISGISHPERVSVFYLSLTGFTFD